MHTLGKQTHTGTVDSDVMAARPLKCQSAIMPANVEECNWLQMAQRFLASKPMIQMYYICLHTDSAVRSALVPNAFKLKLLTDPQRVPSNTGFYSE